MALTADESLARQIAAILMAGKDADITNPLAWSAMIRIARIVVSANVPGTLP